MVHKVQIGCLGVIHLYVNTENTMSMSFEPNFLVWWYLISCVFQQFDLKLPILSIKNIPIPFVFVEPHMRTLMCKLELNAVHFDLIYKFFNGFKNFCNSKCKWDRTGGKSRQHTGHLVMSYADFDLTHKFINGFKNIYSPKSKWEWDRWWSKNRNENPV